MTNFEMVQLLQAILAELKRLNAQAERIHAEVSECRKSLFAIEMTH